MTETRPLVNKKLTLVVSVICDHSVVYTSCRYCFMLQPQFEQLYRQVQTVADSDAELSQMEKCTLNEGLVLIRFVHLMQ